eukprot:scaffold5256_cov126-Isochrysis_galbana.AAC.5
MRHAARTRDRVDRVRWRPRRLRAAYSPMRRSVRRTTRDDESMKSVQRQRERGSDERLTAYERTARSAADPLDSRQR